MEKPILNFSLHSNMFLLIPESGKANVIRIAFTFQYVSINTGSRYIELLRGHFFTFQYASINTQAWIEATDHVWHFTFQYVSINTAIDLNLTDDDIPLHSNMFLLILSRKQDLILFCLPLHSNMFLLIRFFDVFFDSYGYLYIPICFY